MYRNGSQDPVVYSSTSLVDMDDTLIYIYFILQGYVAAL